MKIFESLKLQYLTYNFTPPFLDEIKGYKIIVILINKV